jgi:hypothetical protein
MEFMEPFRLASAVMWPWWSLYRNATRPSPSMRLRVSISAV